MQAKLVRCLKLSGNGMNVSREHLDRAVAECSQAFEHVCEIAAADEVHLGELTAAWKSYYLDDFAHFDRLLRQSIEDGGRHYEHFMPISISHHNLNRLVEVLRSEIGDAPLTSTRIPERIQDLSETIKRLSGILRNKVPTNHPAAGHPEKPLQ
jgi:hypothetical protein